MTSSSMGEASASMEGASASMEGASASMEGASATLRLGTRADARASALLHAGQIDEGFLSTLGPSFLARLYRRVALSDDSFLLIADASGKRVGFLAGALDVASLYKRFLIRDGVIAGVAAAPRLIQLGRVPSRLCVTARTPTPR